MTLLLECVWDFCFIVITARFQNSSISVDRLNYVRTYVLLCGKLTNSYKLKCSLSQRTCLTPSVL